MGLFKNLKNFSLIKKHFDLIEEKMRDYLLDIQNSQTDGLGTTWAQTNIMCCFRILRHLMFPALDEIPKEHYEELVGEFTEIDRTDSKKVDELVKLLSMFNMIKYLSNCQSGNILKDPKVTRESFNNIMFELFKFNENDKDYYNRLSAEFLGHVEIKMIRLIREEMLEKGFGIKADKNLIKIMAFSEILIRYNKVFTLWTS